MDDSTHARHVSAKTMAIVAFSVLLTGCNVMDGWKEKPRGANDVAERESLEQPEIPRVLTEAGWVVRVETEEPSAPHWRHADLEALLALPPEDHPDFRQWLDAKDPIVAGNSAIGMARLGERSDDVVSALTRCGMELLDRLPPGQRIAMRRAAIESLGYLEARSALESLLERFGTYQGKGRAAYQAELHTELIRALDRAGGGLPEGHLAEAIGSPDPEVRLEVLRVWKATAEDPLPREVVELSSDSDPRVRAALLEVLVAQNHPEALEKCRRALDDAELDVQFAALAALGKLKTEEGIALLQVYLEEEQPERFRAEAVKALASAGDRKQVHAAASDKAWQVRQAVATTLSDDESPEAAVVAGRLLNDPSNQVSLALFQSLSEWRLPRVGPILLDALESERFGTRKAASELLADRWESAPLFPADAGPKQRTERLAELRKRWKSTFVKSQNQREAPKGTGRNQISAQEQKQIEHYLKSLASPHPSDDLRRRYCEALVSMGPGLLPALEYYLFQRKQSLPDDVYTDVLPRVDAIFSEIERLSSEQLSERRAAAKSLRSSHAKLNRIALARLVDLVAPEQDALVWRAIQRALREDDREEVAQLQATAMTHPSAEVRRRACEYFAVCPQLWHADVLVEALDDSDHSVVIAALEAIRAQGELDNPLPVVRLTASRDKTICVAAAVTLLGLGYDKGADALERLAQDVDPDVRRVAAEAMGRAQIDRFVPALIELLDDPQSVRRAALASLKQIVDEDKGRSRDGTLPSVDEQIRRWHQWHLLDFDE